MILLAALLAFILLLVLCLAPRRPSLSEEERELREYFKRKDAAEFRGERYPP